MPVIADELVEPDFGTGALKVTPATTPWTSRSGAATTSGPDGDRPRRAHERGCRKARRADAGGADEASRRVAQGARPAGEAGDLPHIVGTCERCHTRIEPLVSLQWWLAMEEPRKPASRRCRSGASATTPSPSTSSRSARSRRCRLEHLAPALVGSPAPTLVCPDGRPPAPGRRPRVRRVRVCRSSSASRTSWTPGSRRRSGPPPPWAGPRTLTRSLRRYYRGDINSTAREIIRLWVNRMIWSGLELIGDLPFYDVIIHSTVLAPDGRRMSKSLGTGDGPARADRQHGADATRYGLLKMSSTPDVRFASGAFVRGSKFATHLERCAAHPHEREGAEPAACPQALEERWILARLDAVRGEIEEDWGRFDFAASSRPSTRSPSTTSATGTPKGDEAPPVGGRLRRGRHRALRPRATAPLLHPVLPHVTEEIWEQLPGPSARLIVSVARATTGAYAAMRCASTIRDAAEIARRSSILIELSEGRAPDLRGHRQQGAPSPNGSPRARSPGCRRRSRASRACSGTSASSRTRPPRWSRASATSCALRRELDALGG